MQEKDRHEVMLLIFWSRRQTADILYVAICAHLVEVSVFDCSPGQANRDMNFCNSDFERGEGGTHGFFGLHFGRPENAYLRI